jgi:hypothetical protein
VGQRAGSGFSTLILTRARGIDGEASLLKLTAEHGPLPETRISATPRGGEQYFFNWDKNFDIHNSASKIGVGLDVRGAGGYVIMPPSVRADGVAYRWLNSLPPADAPQWLIDAATKARYLDQRGTPSRATRQAEITIRASWRARSQRPHTPYSRLGNGRAEDRL